MKDYTKVEIWIKVIFGPERTGSIDFHKNWVKPKILETLEHIWEGFSPPKKAKATMYDAGIFCEIEITGKGELKKERLLSIETEVVKGIWKILGYYADIQIEIDELVTQRLTAVDKIYKLEDYKEYIQKLTEEN